MKPLTEEQIEYLDQIIKHWIYQSSFLSHFREYGMIALRQLYIFMFNEEKYYDDIMIDIPKMKTLNFTYQQMDWLCAGSIDNWYLLWRRIIISTREPHHLGLLKEQLKSHMFQYVMAGMKTEELETEELEDEMSGN